MRKVSTKKITSIGGSALIEGIMMRGPKRTTVCVRTGENEIYSEDIKMTTIPEKCKLFKLPLLRGIAGLIDSMRLSYKSLMLSADKAVEAGEVEEEEPSKFEKWLDEKFGDKLVKVIMVFASILGVALAVALFFFLPSFLFDLTANVVPVFQGDGAQAQHQPAPFVHHAGQFRFFLVPGRYHGMEHPYPLLLSWGLLCTLVRRKSSLFFPVFRKVFFVSVPAVEKAAFLWYSDGGFPHSSVMGGLLR